jgi:hypothetical protein
MARRKKTKKGLPAKGRMRDIADDLWKRAVRNDWNDRCAVCGAARGSKELHTHHLFSRSWPKIRYDLRNGIALCASHHKFDPAVSPHANGKGFDVWLKEHHPLRWKWFDYQGNSKDYKQFDGIRNEQYYCDAIRSLKQYFDDETYTSIVGVRFSQWLEEQERGE